MDSKIVARQMFELIGQAPMSDRVRGVFQGMADRGDPKSMFDQLTVYIERRPDVGQSVKKVGLVSFESVYPKVKALYEEWEGHQ